MKRVRKYSLYSLLLLCILVALISATKDSLSLLPFYVVLFIFSIQVGAWGGDYMIWRLNIQGDINDKFSRSGLFGRMFIALSFLVIFLGGCFLMAKFLG